MSPAGRGSVKRRRRLERGGDFPLLTYNLRAEEEQTEEDVDAAEEHDDVAQQVHELDFLEVVENDSDEVEGCAENEHAEAFW